MMPEQRSEGKGSAGIAEESLVGTASRAVSLGSKRLIKKQTADTIVGEG
jgi:hypothetical protein